MKLDDILAMWSDDCEIDDNMLGEASSNTPKLHAKYLGILMNTKIRMSKTQAEHDELCSIKRRYYRGELSRVELTELKWEPYQFAKPLKAELEEILKGDPDVAKYALRLEYLSITKDALESIMNQIKQRSFDLKNAISWKQFLAGM